MLQQNGTRNSADQPELLHTYPIKKDQVTRSDEITSGRQIATASASD